MEVVIQYWNGDIELMKLDSYADLREKAEFFDFIVLGKIKPLQQCNVLSHTYAIINGDEIIHLSKGGYGSSVRKCRELKADEVINLTHHTNARYIPQAQAMGLIITKSYREV